MPNLQLRIFFGVNYSYEKTHLVCKSLEGGHSTVRNFLMFKHDPNAQGVIIEVIKVLYFVTHYS